MVQKLDDKTCAAIEAADELIDAVIYKLYGLTKDEIRIVEESISGNDTKVNNGYLHKMNYGCSYF